MADNTDDVIVDLTASGDTNDDGKGETETVKAPKPQGPPPGSPGPAPGPPGRTPGTPRPPVKQTPAPSTPQKKKKKKGRILKIILIIVIVLLIAGFVFEELYFNYLGTRDIFIDAVVRLDPAYGAREHRLDSIENDLDRRQAELDAREKTVGFRESQNDRRGVELDKWEETIIDREQMTMPLYLRKMTEQEQSDLQSLSRSYSLMAPDAAVAILMELEEQDDVAAILYNMSDRNASAILALMDPEYAAEITMILLYK